MSQKKILHLITGLDVGGAEMMLLKTLPLLQKSFDNRVCCIRGHGTIGKQLEKAGIPVSYLELTSLFDVGIIWRFRKVIKIFQPDILVTYLIHADLFGRIFGRLFGIQKIICNQRGFYLNWKFLRTIDRLTKSMVTEYFVQTKHAKEVLMHILRLSERSFSVIPNAIDIDDFEFTLDVDQKKISLGIPIQNINIVCVSNLKPGKGYEELLNAFEQTYSRFKNINLLIVGDGNQKENYLQQIKKYASKDNIFFLGRRVDVKEILRISDIFVLGTYSEGMSNAILEAMASRLAIVTTNIPVNREIIQDDVSGFLVPIKNTQTISERLNFLIMDEDKRKELGDHAYTMVSKSFEINNIVASIAAAYKRILHES